MKLRSCSPYAAVAVLGSSLSACGPTEHYAYIGLVFTEPESDQRIVNAPVEYVTATEADVGSMNPEAYLDLHARSAGMTDDRGECMIWIQALESGPIWDRSGQMDDHLLIRTVVDGVAETLVVKSGTGSGFLRWAGAESVGERVAVRAEFVDFSGGVDGPIPTQERSGLSRVTLEIVDTETGDPIVGAEVEFLTVSNSGIGDVDPDDYIDDHGTRVGRTNGVGMLDVRVITRIAAHRSCNHGIVDDLWIVRVDLGDRQETVVLRDPGALGMSRFFGFEQGIGDTLTITTPFGECFE